MAYCKGEDSRPEIVCTRLTTREERMVLDFARSRNIGVTAAVRMLLLAALEFINGGDDHA